MTWHLNYLPPSINNDGQVNSSNDHNEDFLTVHNVLSMGITSTNQMSQ